MKKVIISLIFTIVFSNVILAQHGGGVSIFIPLAGSFSFSDIRDINGNKINILKSKSAFDFGVLIQPGYFYDFGGLLGFDVLADIGYFRSNYKYRNIYRGNIESYIFDTLNTGALFRITAIVLSLGIGAGIKIPLAGKIDDGNFIYKLNRENIKYYFENTVIPYIKFTIDFKYNLNSFSALGIGLYFNYDFAMSYKNNHYSKYDIHSFDFGVQLGTYLVGSKY